jgi:hypothetical protein
MNAILRACNRADSVYFGSFCIRSRSHMSRRHAAVTYETKTCLPTHIRGRSLMKRDCSGNRTHDPRSRAGGLNDSTTTPSLFLNEPSELRHG